MNETQEGNLPLTAEQMARLALVETRMGIDDFNALSPNYRDSDACQEEGRALCRRLDQLKQQ